MNQMTMNTRMSNSQVPCQRALMQSIYEKGFALDEMVLFLDTHPNNQEALNHYHMLRKEYHELEKMYIMNYGPLQATDVTNENYFDWVNRPMPWEGDK